MEKERGREIEREEERLEAYSKMLLGTIAEGVGELIETMRDEYYDDGYCAGYKDGKAKKEDPVTNKLGELRGEDGR